MTTEVKRPAGVMETDGVKHTPGPWDVCFYDAGDKSYYDHNGPCPSVVARDHDCAVVHWDGFKNKYWSSANGNQSQIVANALLIASAPGLLEALEQLLGNAEIARFHLNATEETMLVGSALFDTIQQARAAIARARGEQDGGGE